MLDLDTGVCYTYLVRKARHINMFSRIGEWSTQRNLTRQLYYLEIYMRVMPLNFDFWF